MKKNRFVLPVFFLMALLALVPSMSFAAAREKIVIAVGQFSDTSGKSLSAAATDYVTSTFIKLKYFRVLERSRIDQVMREIAHSQTGFVDESAAAQVGKQLGAKAIVLGSVTAAKYSLEKGQCVTYDSKGNQVKVTCFTANASVTLNVRMVDVETSEVLFSETLGGSTSETYQGGSQPASETAMLDKALQGAAYKIYPHIQKAFPLVGTVVKKEDQWIWIDLGSDWGMNKGRGLIFYKEKGKEIRHPKTGEIVGYEREQVGEDHVSEVMETMCKAKVQKKEAERIEVGDTVVVKPQIFY
jgi:hypothetical protein